MSERYRRGVDIAAQLSEGSLEEFLTSRVAELAPDFARMAIEFPMGDLYSRDGLDLRSREIVAIASLAALGWPGPHLNAHIRAAQRIGISNSEIVEILMQTAIYAGFPAAMNSLALSHDLLVDGATDQAASRRPGQG